MRERREVCVWIADHELLELFGNWPTTYNRFVHFVGLPPDATPTHVVYEWKNRSFGVLFAHHSFDPVPEGCYAPELQREYETVQLDAFLTRLANGDPVALSALRSLAKQYLSNEEPSGALALNERPA